MTYKVSSGTLSLYSLRINHYGAEMRRGNIDAKSRSSLGDDPRSQGQRKGGRERRRAGLCSQDNSK